MRKRWMVAAALLAPCAVAAAGKPAEVVSTGKRIELKRVLQPERTTVLLVIQQSSAMEQQFLADVEQQLSEQERVALRVARVKDLEAPVAKQFEVTATPTAIVYDRFARVLARTSQPDELRAAVRKGLLMGRIDWIDEDHPKAAEIYGRPAEMLRHGIPGIVKTMSMRPEAFRMFLTMSEIHFTNGFLKRREHELVGAYVSALNKCRF